MTKKRKQSSPDITDDAIKQQQHDFISKLPDKLLIRILSLLDEDVANRTRILSKRWKHLPAFLPNLIFCLTYFESDEEYNKCHDFVDQTLALRGDIPIQRLFLECTRNCDFNRVYKTLCTIVKCQVQQLDLDFSAGGYRVKFCWNLFKKCNTLVSLSLKGNFRLDVPKMKLLFPCLKKLGLLSVYYMNDETLVNLISGCPVLEELFVERQVFCDGMEMFKVSSHSLKRLHMEFTDDVSGPMMYGILTLGSVINVPNLEYLHIEDKMLARNSFTKMPLLVEAHMDTTGKAAELLTCLSSVKTLTLTYPTIKAIISVKGIGICRFSNLVKLEIDISRGMHWDLLLHSFLNNMPNLEHITFLNGLVRAQDNNIMSWTPPKEAPTCLCFKTKEIVIHNRKVITQEEFPLISYLLKHSSVLETFTIKAHNIDPVIREQLINFQRGSNLCRIEFV